MYHRVVKNINQVMKALEGYFVIGKFDVDMRRVGVQVGFELRGFFQVI